MSTALSVGGTGANVATEEHESCGQPVVAVACERLDERFVPAVTIPLLASRDPPLGKGAVGQHQTLYPDLLPEQRGAQMKRKVHQKTQEEKTHDQLVEQEWEWLSEAARDVVMRAGGSAKKSLLEHPDSYTSEQYDSDMRALSRAAAEITEDDLEGLTKIWHSALAAAGSIDPYDYETPVTCDAYCAHLHRYYRLLSSKVEEVEWEKRCEVDRKKLSEQELAVIEDPPSDANIAIKRQNRNLRPVR